MKESENEVDLEQSYSHAVKLSKSLYHEISKLRRISGENQHVIRSMQEKIAQLKKHNQTLEEQLQDCQARILRSSPVADLSDATVLAEFSRIRETLSNWVEELPEVLEDIADHLSDTFNDLSLNSHVSKDTNSYPQGPLAVQSELLMHLVFCRLSKGLFEVLVPGISPSDNDLLDDLREGLLSLQPKNEFKNVIGGVPNIIEAYVASQRYQKGVDNECFEIIADLDDFFWWIDFECDVKWDSKMANLSTDILEPAVSLATKMSCSPAQYRWKWHGEAYFPQRVVRKYHLKQFTVQDARTHNRITVANLETMPDETPIGELLVIIFPALFRCTDNGNEDIQIEKAVILIRTNEDLQRQKRSENRSRMFRNSVIQMFKDSALGQPY
ncbi:hypothetical protein BO83DRAFT_400051 [Aspergillus eucalypticola CBS 122712]|uniref:Uncharacterized protein n=1 Tax=Aspergillus eucalypticola (strain CBS 122712 / IBT 29274) TaxID=1448314 RepID=A0A317V7M3_ASPEC|nr:uncharacterized protein BO83DRAFT_400051 [Aspergillus eucalypticola CBS 122712]PWY70035.1 hypothetical protein BO83DRAFT_400051 [Aspergillus eucalypticola CBS 122712]